MIFAIICAPIFVGAVLGLLYYRHERSLTHIERMRALELGQSPPLDARTAQIQATLTKIGEVEDKQGERSPSSRCFSTALWVAFWGFLAASAGPEMAKAPAGVAIAIAAAAGAIGVTAMICGTILARGTPALANPPPKLRGEDEALDFVARRG